MRTTIVRDPLETIVIELAQAIELRDCGDPDGWDPAAARRIRQLERALVEELRHRPLPRNPIADGAAMAAAGLAAR